MPTDAPRRRARYHALVQGFSADLVEDGSQQLTPDWFVKLRRSVFAGNHRQRRDSQQRRSRQVVVGAPAHSSEPPREGGVRSLPGPRPSAKYIASKGSRDLVAWFVNSRPCSASPSARRSSQSFSAIQAARRRRLANISTFPWSVGRRGGKSLILALVAAYFSAFFGWQPCWSGASAPRS